MLFGGPFGTYELTGQCRRAPDFGLEGPGVVYPCSRYVPTDPPKGIVDREDFEGYCPY